MRRWFRRTVLLVLALVLLLGGAAGWLYLDWRAEQPALAMVRQSGGWAKHERIGPAWLARMMGPRLAFLLERTYQVELFSCGGRVPAVGDTEMVALSQLPRLRTLSIASPGVTDVGLIHLKHLSQLEILKLYSSPQIGNEGIKHLAGLANLRELWLSHTNVTASGLQYLTGLTSLERLVLGPEELSLHSPEECVFDPGQVDLAGFEVLKRMTGLRELIIDTGCRDGQWCKWLQKVLPNAAIGEHLMTP